MTAAGGIELTAALKSLLFGGALAATIGPIALLIMRYGANAGFGTAAVAGCGAALADLSYALMAFTGGHWLVPRLLGHRLALDIASSLVLLVMGLHLLRKALQMTSAEVPAAASDTARPLHLVYGLTMLNPLTVVTFAGFAAQLPRTGTALASVGYSLCLFIGSLTVQLSFAAGGAALTKSQWRRPINVGSAVAVAMFGAAGLLRLC